MKKQRPDPFAEGSIASIYRWFFGPLIRYKSLHAENLAAYNGRTDVEIQEPTINEWMEYLFHTKFREVGQYVARRAFEMPGLLVINSVTKIQGIGYRKVRAGQEMWVRTDERTPEQVEVEIMAGKGKADQVFELSSQQWNAIRSYLIERDHESSA